MSISLPEHIYVNLKLSLRRVSDMYRYSYVGLERRNYNTYKKKIIQSIKYSIDSSREKPLVYSQEVERFFL
jgi:hypothetical protein